MADKNREKALDLAVAQIEKQFGKGSIMRLGDGQAVEKLPVISTGSLGLDIALGVGGLPCGRVTEIYGPEASGKTTLALHAVAESQKNGGTCAFIDAEHALDPTYAQKLGVNVEDLLVAQPDNPRAVTVLFQLVLARSPKDEETTIVLDHIEQVGDRSAAFEDVLWSLLNSAEFTTKR